MRLLHRRHDDAGPGLAATQFQADRRGDPCRARAASLSLRHAHADPAGGAPRRTPDGYRRTISDQPGERAMNAPVILNRRHVLAGGGALIVSFSLTRAFAQEKAAAPAHSLPPSLKTAPYLDSWIRIDANGAITAFTGKAELGQGFKTAFQQIAAEQLDVPFASLKVVTADTALTANEGYTSGSHSMQDSGTAILNAAAQARALLLAEAAKRLDQPVDTLRTDNGAVIAADGRRVGYGELVAGDVLHVQAQPESPLKDP